MVTYDIVHIHPDKTEELIKTVKNPHEIPYVTEQPKYLGTWIREDRKLLRWSRGELVVRMNEQETKVINCRTVHIGSLPIYELQVVHHEILRKILVNSHTIVGQDLNGKSLWQTNSWTKLADIVGKEVAYVCSQYYERYLTEFNLEGAM